MEGNWLPVSTAAAALHVGPEQIRRLIKNGELAAVRRAGRWFVDPADVQRRLLGQARPGRPLSPTNAWLLLHLLASQETSALPPRLPASSPVPLTRLQRHRLGALLADLPPASELGRLLHARASWERVRAHPGVLERLMADERVRVGGALAAAGQGGGVAAGGRPVLYVRGVDASALRGAYHLEPDPSGNITLGVVDDKAAELVAALAPGGGLMPLAVAWADLVDDIDPRARTAAQAWIEKLGSSLPLADLTSGAKPA